MQTGHVHHRHRRHVPRAASNDDRTFQPKGPGGGGYPHDTLEPMDCYPDDDGYTAKGPGGGGYPVSGGQTRPPSDDTIYRAKGPGGSGYPGPQGDLNVVG